MKRFLYILPFLCISAGAQAIIDSNSVLLEWDPPSPTEAPAIDHVNIYSRLLIEPVTPWKLTTTVTNVNKVRLVGPFTNGFTYSAIATYVGTNGLESLPSNQVDFKFDTRPTPPAGLKATVSQVVVTVSVAPVP